MNPPTFPPATQTSDLIVLPTRTIYEFDAGGEHIAMTFLTPKLPDDLFVCSWPVTYVTWTATGTQSHQVQVYIDARAELAVNTPGEAVTYSSISASNLSTGTIKMLAVGSVEQPVLEARGDDLRINWGNFYLAGKTECASIFPENIRDEFANSGAANWPTAKLPANPPASKAALLAMAFDLGDVSSQPKSARAMLIYDDLYSIRYFNNDLLPYWRTKLKGADELAAKADADFDSLNKRCESFDNELVSDLKKIGGDSYAELGVLAWRQALAAQKLCADANGQPLMFSKENFSNGCISTVDVLYPAGPQMLAFSPTMMKASLVPLLDYSSSPRWKFDSAPHDLGTYPQATGQVYGGERSSPLPVEESGNLLLLCGALAKAEGNADFSGKYWPTLTAWKNYLVNNGLDPANQLCTDDFAGHIARNANLSVKAIMGIAAYGQIADMLGKKDEAADAMKTARDYAQKWMKLGEDGDHYKLVFGDKGAGTWSQKYNLVWDRILGTNIFPPEVAEKELAFYRTKMNVYGLPLDSRKTYTKIDWELWTATMAPKDDDFRVIVDACAKWTNETPDRVPMSDWYETVSGKKSGFQARSVVGGLFIPFVRDESLWKKYASRDHTKLTGWAAADFSQPKVNPIIPAADTQASTWKYTTAKPAARWMDSTFNDSTWKSGQSGFGTEGTPGAHIGTTWNTDDIWIRREITLPDTKLKNPRLYIHHDEDAEVYINGTLAARPRGFVAEYVTVPISPTARAKLHPGKNILAVHCHQTTGGQYIDVGIVEVVVNK